MTPTDEGMRVSPDKLKMPLTRWPYSDHVPGDPSYKDALGRVFLESELVMDSKEAE